MKDRSRRITRQLRVIEGLVSGVEADRRRERARDKERKRDSETDESSNGRVQINLLLRKICLAYRFVLKPDLSSMKGFK